MEILDTIQSLPKIQPEKDEQRELLQSDELKDLFSALAKAQGEMRIAGNRSDNPFFKSKYADLAEIVSVARVPLKNHGLSFIQRQLPNEDGANYLYTMLCHSSGQYISSKTRVMPVKNDPQSKGSALTYEKRYALAALLGIVSADEDDDGERAMVGAREEAYKGTSPNIKYNPREESSDPITNQQYKMLEDEIGPHADLVKQMKDWLSIGSLVDMPQSRFSEALKKIRQIRFDRENPKLHK